MSENTSRANLDLCVLAVPKNLSDYDHYEIDGMPVYQSRNNGMLFAEDATPLTWYGDRLCDLIRLARGLIKIKGSSDDLEECLSAMKARKELFSRVLEAGRLK